MEILLGTATGIFVSFVCMLYYRQGIKDGRNIKDEKPLEKIIEPKVSKEEKAQFDSLNKTLEAINSFEPQTTRSTYGDN